LHRSRSRSPAPYRPHPPPQRSQSPPPYTNYRRRTPPASAAHLRTPPTPYRPVTPQEPPTEDSGTLPDARNRSPSILGWDTYIGNRQTARSANPFHTRRSPSPDRRHTRSPPFHHHRGNLASANSFHTCSPSPRRPRGDLANRGGWSRQGVQGIQRIDFAQNASREGSDRGGVSRGRGRGRRQRSRPLHERIRF